jgi:ribosomal protein L37AE/L43A
MIQATHMALRTPTMSLYNSDQSSERWHLLRKLILLILLVVALVLGLVLLSRQKVDFPSQLFNILADISVGVATGMGSRFVLRQRHWFIQGLASTAIAVVGLAVLGYLTDWKSGIDLQRLSSHELNWSNLLNMVVAMNWPAVGSLLFGHSRIDLISLANMVIAVVASWIALRAWTTSPSMVVGSPVAAAAAQPRSRSRSRTISPPVAAYPRVRARAAINSGPRIKQRKLDRPILASAAAPAPGSARVGRSKRWNALKHKPDVQLAVYEEHRCPYCFEVVKRNDARGVVECEVCHTLHHKDCWDVTGTCQVPHLNT